MISSLPLKFIEPTIDAFKGKSDTRAKEVIDFPDPLSPTKESVVPLLILKFELIKTVLLSELFLKLIDISTIIPSLIVSTPVVIGFFLGKIIRRSSKISFHDEANVCSLGDKVTIKECRPISKTKSWTLVEILKEGKS